jgi:hypothetical protein
VRRWGGEREGSYEDETRQPYLVQGDKSISLNYSLYIFGDSFIVTYLGSLAGREAFSGPSLKVDGF